MEIGEGSEQEKDGRWELPAMKTAAEIAYPRKP
jgi:hypothetical protein